MAHYRLHCIGASGNSYKLALYMNCAGLDWEPVGVDFAGGETRDADWRDHANPMGEVPVLEWIFPWRGTCIIRLTRPASTFQPNIPLSMPGASVSQHCRAGSRRMK